MKMIKGRMINGQRELTQEEKDFVYGWLRDIDIKNKSVTGRLMSLHDWEKGLKRAKKNFQEENK